MPSLCATPTWPLPGGKSPSSAIWRLLRATAYYSSNMMPIIRDSYLVFICCLLAQAVYFHICYFWLPVSVYTIRSDVSQFRFTSHCISMLHPQDRIVLTCICRNGITDEIDSRHCIHTPVAGSLYCGMCVANDCSYGCGPCGYADVDSGYHLPNQTQLLGSSGSDDTTSEGPASMSTSSSSEDPEWISALQERNNKRKFCSEYNSKTCSDQARITPAHVDIHSQESPGDLVEFTRCPCPAGCLYEGEYGLATCLLCSPQNCTNGQCCCPCAGCYPDSELEENFWSKWQWIMRWVICKSEHLQWLHPAGHL